MDSQKLLRIMGHVLLWLYAFGNLLMIFLAHRFNYGPEIAGKYSIYSSKGFFIAYHVWGIIVAAIVSYSLIRQIRMLFMISLFLLLILMFYPWYSTDSSISTNQPHKEQIVPGPTKPDSVQ